MKRFFALCLLLSLVLCPCARASERLTFLSGESGQTLVLDERGALVGEEGEYALLMRLTPEDETPLYAAALSSSSEAIFLLSGAGEALTAAGYTALEYDGGYLIFWQGDRCGVMDLTGRELTACDYSWLLHAGGDCFFAFRRDHLDDTADELHLLSLSGGETDTGLYIGYGPESGDGLFAAYDPRTRLYGYLNAQGQWAVAPRFDWAGRFQAGRAVAAEQGALGLIDGSGEWILEPQLSCRQIVLPEGEGMLAFALSATGVLLYSAEDGRLLREYGPGSVSAGPGGFCALYLDDATVLLDPSGEEVCRYAAGAVLDLTRGERFLVRREGEWGAPCEWICRLDTGETLSGPYQEASLLGTQGETDYFLVSSFETEVLSGGAHPLLGEVSGTRRWGVVDAQGNELLPLEYERIISLSDTLLAVKKDGEWTLKDREQASASPALP